jgi:hypothetical protein
MPKKPELFKINESFEELVNIVVNNNVKKKSPTLKINQNMNILNDNNQIANDINPKINKPK